MRTIHLISLFLLVSFYGISQNHSSVIYQKLQYCKLEGIKDSVLCGKYPVFENRQSSTGRLINLNIVVIPALHRNSTAVPIFYFEGGPGVAATNNASFFADSTVPYRNYHDIVLIDIRGTGKSNGLDCPSLQIKKGIKDHFEEMYPKDAVKECYDFLSKKADLKQYTTTNVVKDIEEVRKWLGYKKINIFGLSYGTRVALVYMKMFASSIASSILWSPVPTYAKMPLYHATFAQASLDQIFKNCELDSGCYNAFPNLTKEFNLLMESKRAKPFSLLYTDSSGSSAQISFSWNAFQTKLRTLLYAPMGIQQIPHIIHQTYLGNLNPFISLYPTKPDTSTFSAEGLYLCITCTEDVPFMNAKQIDSLTKKTFMGSYRIDQQRNACSQWARGNVPADYFIPVKSNIPTLILSGGLDPITPFSQAKEIASHLSKSTLVLIPQMSHTYDGLSNPECFDNVCLSFIDDPLQAKLDLDCFKKMKPEHYRIKD